MSLGARCITCGSLCVAPPGRAAVDNDRFSAGGVIWHLAQSSGSTHLSVDVDPLSRPAGQSSTVQSSGMAGRRARAQAQGVLLGRPGERHRVRRRLVGAGGSLAPVYITDMGVPPQAVCRSAAGALPSHSGVGQRAGLASQARHARRRAAERYIPASES